MSPSEVRGLLLDLSGTLYVGEELIKGAREAITSFRNAGVPVLYVTNTTSKARRRILERMTRLGISVKPEEVISPSTVATRILGEAGHRRCHFLLKEGVLEDFPEIESTDRSPDAVVVGDMGEDFDYATLNLAFKLLMKGAAFYALAANRYFESDGGLQLDMGPFVAALESATNRKAQLVGKPSATFFNAAVQELGLRADEVGMVGDDIESDIGGAKAAGLSGFLVKTGKYRAEIAEASGVEPDRILDSIAELPAILGC